MLLPTHARAQVCQLCRRPNTARRARRGCCWRQCTVRRLSAAGGNMRPLYSSYCAAAAPACLKVRSQHSPRRRTGGLYVCWMVSVCKVDEMDSFGRTEQAAACCCRTNGRIGCVLAEDWRKGVALGKGPTNLQPLVSMLTSTLCLCAAGRGLFCVRDRVRHVMFTQLHVHRRLPAYWNWNAVAHDQCLDHARFLAGAFPCTHITRTQHGGPHHPV